MQDHTVGELRAIVKISKELDWEHVISKVLYKYVPDFPK